MLAQQPNILITDDDRHFRETLRGVIEPLGFRTRLADDGEQALEIVRHEPVDLLLLDMHMPKLTGIETLRKVKQLKAMLPCILITGMLDETIRREAVRARAFSVLSKPVTRREIVRQISQAMYLTYRWD